MKTLFASRIGQEPEFYDNLLENATIAFDANVLLNLYRYSEETREQIFDVLEQLNSRIILPYQAAVEYFNNRTNVIDEQCKAYEKTQKGLSDIKSALENKKTHPFITRMLSNKFNNVIDEVIEELVSNNKSYDEFISNDEIMKKISNLFDNKIVSELNEAKLNEAIAEGVLRYKHKTPPGYADEKEKSKGITEDSPLQERVRPFGDFIIWLQLIEYSKINGVDIIFVTDDTKEDWFDKARGKVIAPRNELIREFNKKSGNNFHSYPIDYFLTKINEHISTVITEETVHEVTAISKAKTEDLSQRILSRKIINFDHKNVKLKEASINGLDRYHDLSDIIQYISRELHNLNSSKEKVINEMDRLNDFYSTDEQLNSHTIERLEYLSNKLDKLAVDRKMLERSLFDHQEMFNEIAL